MSDTLPRVFRRVWYLRRVQVVRWIAVSMAFGGLAALIPTGCAGTPPCERNSDCSEGYCFEGECRKNCVDSKLDCPKGTFCNVLAQCEPEPTGSGVGGSSVDAAVNASVGPGAGSTVASGASTSGGGGSMLLERCTMPGECGGGLACLPMTVGGASRCTRSCGGDLDCPTGTRCIDRGGKFCFGDDVGRYCTSPANCNFGCLTGPKYCTAGCTDGADCPVGYGCQAVGNPPTRVCVRAEAYCSAGDTGDCLVPSACDESPSLVIGGCTLACSSAADCPRRAAPLAPWSCDGLCRRPFGVFGSLPGGYSPVEYHCDGNGQPVALCNDGQHLDFDAFTVPPAPSVNCGSNSTTAGVAGDACVNSCRYQGGCSHGFACVGLGAVGSERIGLCMPVGQGEPGSACTRSRDCAFGYCTAMNLCSRDCTEDGICTAGTSCVAVAGPTIEGKIFKRCE